MKNTDALIVIVALLGFASWVLFEFMSSSAKDEDKREEAKKAPTPKKRKTKDKKSSL